MRVVLGALLLIACNSFATPVPLRFSIADSWSMPMVQIEDGVPRQGILFDMMNSLARQVGQPAQFHVLARARVQSAMEQGEVDIRCYSAQSWLGDRSGDYAWSIPLFIQRDLLLGNADRTTPVRPQQLANQTIGTVLSYTYPTLQPLFDSGQLKRDDARTQEQVLQKLAARRSEYAVSNQWSFDWYNQQQPAEHRLRVVAILQEQPVGCFVRNDPSLPVQSILRTLLKMKMSGEIDDLIQLYTGNSPDRDLPPRSQEHSHTLEPSTDSLDDSPRPTW